MKDQNTWPEIDYASWSPTLNTLHQWVQIVGKIRLRTMPWQNHSWHSTLYVSNSGFTTQSIPLDRGSFQIDFDFLEHKLNLQSSFADTRTIPLRAMSVAEFHDELFDLLDQIELNITIHSSPNKLEHTIPFKENRAQGYYDSESVTTYWKALREINGVFSAFNEQFVGKRSPVHLFWGGFDLSVSRYSGRPAPPFPGSMPNVPSYIMKESFSKEVSTAGFWPGSKSNPQPGFYSFCYPAPLDFEKQNIRPKEAYYKEESREFFLNYETVQQSPDPSSMLFDFLESTYLAAAVSGNWDREALERKG